MSRLLVVAGTAQSQAPAGGQQYTIHAASILRYKPRATAIIAPGYKAMLSQTCMQAHSQHWTSLCGKPVYPCWQPTVM
jgi:anaerobic C4-dicarboxylate transporter